MATLVEIKALLTEQKQSFDLSLQNQKQSLDLSLQNQKQSFDLVIKTLIDKVDVMGLKVDSLAAKNTNGSAGRMDKLVKVPRASDGSLPPLFPENLMSLLVAGNESLPDNTKNNWNAKKSKQLLIFYDGSLSGSDDESEHSEKARERRLKVARTVGISQVQLNYAQLTL